MTPTPPSSIQRARAALEDDAKASKDWLAERHVVSHVYPQKGPGWTAHAPTLVRGRFKDILYGEDWDHGRECSGHESDFLPADLLWIVRARTREPLLAADVLALAKENERLEAERDEWARKWSEADALAKSRTHTLESCKKALAHADWWTYGNWNGDLVGVGVAVTNAILEARDRIKELEQDAALLPTSEPKEPSRDQG